MARARSSAWALAVLLAGVVPGSLTLPVDAPKVDGVPDAMSASSSPSPPPLLPSEPGQVSVTSGSGRSAPQPVAAAKARELRTNLPDTAYGRFVTKSAEALQADELTRSLFMRFVQNYYHEAGYNVPSVSEDDDTLNEFDENETLTFTYNLGDVDGDKVDDFAFDMYCVDWDGCYAEPGCPLIPNPFRPDFLECVQKPPEAQLNFQDYCGTPHRLMLISGVNGTEIWRRNLGFHDAGLITPEQPMDYLGCPIEFVVGAAPSPDGGYSLVIQKIVGLGVAVPTSIFGPSYVFAQALNHTVYMVDRINGGVLWTRSWNGLFAGDVLTVCFNTLGLVCEIVLYADTVLINPILQIAPHDQGVKILPNKGAGQRPTLFIQGVGFDWEYIATPPMITETPAYRPWVDRYEPREWAASLNLENGVPYWSQKTFQPDQKPDSVLPRALPEFMAPLVVGPPFEPLSARYWYWNYVPCCFDLTGDLIPDMPFTTWEWNPTPNTNDRGPYFFASRLVLYAGDGGTFVWETYTELNAVRYQDEEYDFRLGFFPYFELLGDATGDGVSDVLLHKAYFQFDYRHEIAVHDGKTGAQIWNYTSARDLRPIVLGDADGDGGNDFLLLDWFDWQHVGTTLYDYSNVTAKPLIVYSGKTGEKVWESQTFSAPIDLDFLIMSFRINGVPDLNRDGVGEFPADDPLMLGDLTVIHRQTFLDGKTGLPVRDEIRTVGTFGVPATTANITGDATEDFVIMSGDVNDIWLTLYDGATNEAKWSRRVMTLKLTEYTLAIPQIRMHPVMTQRHVNDTLINFSMQVISFGGYRFVDATYPQIAYYGGRNGTLPWAHPRLWDANFTILVRGMTPASFAFQRLLDESAQPTGYAAATLENGSYLMPGLLSFATMAAVGLGIARRWRK